MYKHSISKLKWAQHVMDKWFFIEYIQFQLLNYHQNRKFY